MGDNPTVKKEKEPQVVEEVKPLPDEVKSPLDEVKEIRKEAELVCLLIFQKIDIIFL